MSSLTWKPIIRLRSETKRCERSRDRHNACSLM